MAKEDRPLTARQAAFVRGILEGVGQGEAARRAGYSPRDADHRGYLLAQKSTISKAIAAGRASLSAETQTKASDVLAWLRDHRVRALAEKDHSAANKAAELIGKQIGMFVDRHEVDVSDRLARVFDSLAGVGTDDE